MIFVGKKKKKKVFFFPSFCLFQCKFRIHSFPGLFLRSANSLSERNRKWLKFLLDSSRKQTEISTALGEFDVLRLTIRPYPISYALWYFFMSNIQDSQWSPKCTVVSFLFFFSHDCSQWSVKIVHISFDLYNTSKCCLSSQWLLCLNSWDVNIFLTWISFLLFGLLQVFYSFM